MPPLIGITVDNAANSADTGRYESAIRYSASVAAMGGLPLLLPHIVERAASYVAVCDGLLLTGGADPVMEGWGVATDSRARRMDARRQTFELALLDAAACVANPLTTRDAALPTPVLGICLGMQLMALHAGGRLDQYLPDTLPTHADHVDDRRHPLIFHARDSVLRPPDVRGTVVSSHRQAVADAGRLRVVATAPDGTIEAIDDPTRPFYLGVQWHPERCDQSTPDAEPPASALEITAPLAPPDLPPDPLNPGLIASFVAAARRRQTSTA